MVYCIGKARKKQTKPKPLSSLNLLCGMFMSIPFGIMVLSDRRVLSIFCGSCCGAQPRLLLGLGCWYPGWWKHWLLQAHSRLTPLGTALGRIPHSFIPPQRQPLPTVWTVISEGLFTPKLCMAYADTFEVAALGFHFSFCPVLQPSFLHSARPSTGKSPHQNLFPRVPDLRHHPSNTRLRLQNPHSQIF